jgi:hypothetical protein
MALMGATFALGACGANAVGDEETRPLAQGSLPLRLSLAEDAPGVWDTSGGRFEVIEVLKNAADVWNQAAGVILIQFDGTRARISSPDFARDDTSRDGVNGVYVFEDFGDTRVTLGAESPTDILGLCVSRGFESDIALTLMARVRRNSGGMEDWKQIRAADLVANRWTPNAFDFESVAIHEFGHALGLPHDTTDEQSVMWHQGLSVGRVNRALSASDKGRLKDVVRERYGFALDIDDTTTDSELVAPSGT